MAYHYDDVVPFETLKGLTLAVAEKVAEDEILFVAEGGDRFKLLHRQSCCEDVYVDDICGDLAGLIGAPLLSVEESSNSDGEPKNSYDESFTWTFYKLSTIKGSVAIRWYGASNGYYSECVDLVRAQPA